MNAPELSRPVEVSRIGNGVRQITANEQERAALARRFGLVAVERLEADLELAADGPAIVAAGRLRAGIVQTCAVSGEPFAVSIDEPLSFRFVPARERTADEEVELSEDDCDEIEYDGDSFDLGEEVAQSLALAIDPFATGPQADAVRREAGLLDEDSAGPFAALAALKPKS